MYMYLMLSALHIDSVEDCYFVGLVNVSNVFFSLLMKEKEFNCSDLYNFFQQKPLLVNAVLFCSI